MAINRLRRREVPGTPCTEPTFGLPALWIDEVHRELAQTLGYGGGSEFSGGNAP